MLTPGESRSPLRYGLFSTMRGTTVVFDFHKMNGGQPIYKSSPFDGIPPVFRQWLEDEEVVVLGADVAGDASVAGVRAAATLDTRLLYERLRQPGYLDFSDPIINVYGMGNRAGLGAQAYFAKGVDYKPQLESTYVRFYGAHRYTHQGAPKWPWWRKPVLLYQWNRGAQGRVEDQHHWYWYHDATTPVALVHRVLLTVIMRNPWCTVYEDRSLVQRIQDLLSPFVRNRGGVCPRPPPRAKLALPVDDGLSSSASSPGPPPPVEVCPVPPDWRPMSPDRMEAITVKSDSSSSLEVVQERLGQPTTVWGPTQEFKSAWETEFRRGNRCAYCASTRHIMKDSRNKITCPRYIAGESYSCKYKYCEDKEPHCTAMCVSLQSTCSSCWVKGHSEAQRCEDWDEAEWQQRRDAWEAAADRGVNSSKRRENWSHGFYTHRRFTPWPFPFESYTHLITVPVLKVLTILRDWAHGIAPLPPHRPRPAFHDEPRPKSKKRPPPEESQYKADHPLPRVGRLISEEFYAGRIRPEPAGHVPNTLAAAQVRRPPPSVFSRIRPPPAKRVKQAVIRQVPRLLPPTPPASKGTPRPVKQAVIRPVPPRLVGTARIPGPVSVIRLPDMSRPPPSASATSASASSGGAPPPVPTARAIVIRQLHMRPPPPPRGAPAGPSLPLFRPPAPLLPLPPSPPRDAPTSRRTTSPAPTDTVEMELRSEDGFEPQ